MTGLVLAQSAPQLMLSHMALFGLASILEAHGAADVTITWTGGANPRPRVDGHDLDDHAVAAAVHTHARAHAENPQSWVQRDLAMGKPRALMSPRQTPPADPQQWQQLQTSRHVALDELTGQRSWLDLRFLAALGEPSYWTPYPDDGASRLEMQPRNTGAEFVKTRLRKLADHVAKRTVHHVRSGLTGETLVDECGSGKADSQTSTGFAGIGPTDNALAWCALWGISAFPLAMRVATGNRFGRPAVSSGHADHRRAEYFFVPFWNVGWRPARLRSVIAARALAVAAMAGQGPSDEPTAAARTWLRTRDVRGIVRFPVGQPLSGKTRERRAMSGQFISVETTQ